MRSFESEDKSLRIEKDDQKPILAICYDFDKTLSPNDMQAQGFIQKNNYDVKKFWEQSNELAKNNKMDQNSAWMHMMIKTSTGKQWVTRKNLIAYGKTISLYNGVDTWFDRVNKIGEKYGVIVKHFIISSGLKEMIEGTSIFDKFDQVYASSFFYDKDDLATWPANIINYTNKTQFLFRIEKGILDQNSSEVNDLMDDFKKPIPFENMVYIGDSDTDIPCMEIVNSRNGYSIAVYDPDKKDKTKVYKMMREERIKLFAPADYSKGKELESIIEKIIKKISSSFAINEEMRKCNKDFRRYENSISKEAKQKAELIFKLSKSSSFAETHVIVRDLLLLMSQSPLNNEEKEKLRDAFKNPQVSYIRNDTDIEKLYRENGFDVEELIKAIE